ncbi:carboxypeptidase-like regulatory domain-containing protein [Flavobacterium sp.]
MNAEQTDILSMQKVVENLWNDAAPTILDQMPGIGPLKVTFSDNINTIDILYNGQKYNRTGTHMTKEEYREDMMQLAFSTAARTCAYAISINDEQLQIRVTHVYSNMQKIRDTLIANTCTDIYNIALDLGAVLLPFGVTLDSLQVLKDSITLYRVIQPKPRAGIADQTVFTTRIVELFADNAKVLFNMDKLVIMLRFDEHVFYETYFANRKIIDTGSRRLSLRGNITDEQGLPIDGVTITIETPHAVAAKSTDLGNYQFKGIEGGVWAVTYKRNGFKEQKEYLVFTPNKRVDFNVVLKAIEQQQRSA